MSRPAPPGRDCAAGTSGRARRTGTGRGKVRWGRWVRRRRSGTAGCTDPGHGQRLSPGPDHDDPPFAGGIGHGGLGQVPGHRGHDRADPAELTWLAGQPASARHGTLSFGLPFSSSLTARSPSAPRSSPGSSPKPGMPGQVYPAPPIGSAGSRGVSGESSPEGLEGSDGQ